MKRHAPKLTFAQTLIAYVMAPGVGQPRNPAVRRELQALVAYARHAYTTHIESNPPHRDVRCISCELWQKLEEASHE